jgi:porphobilinogen synthase
MPYPATRLRRLRQSSWSRALVAEHSLSPSNLILGSILSREDMPADPQLPGLARHSIAATVERARRARDLGIAIIALFPNIDPALKDVAGSEALNPDGLIPQAVRALKDEVPGIGIMVDIALDPYTSHGHDGVLRDGHILNDETVAILAEQARLYASAGASIIAPSDMMDGRIGAIRAALEKAGYTDTLILSYAAKYASAFYGPYRAAVGSAGVLTGDKRSYQMDPANRHEAQREVCLDIEEGADIIMVKPGLAYLDICRDLRERFGMPLVAFQTSGEYAMFRCAADAGFLDERAALLEALMSYRRAGCSAVVSYYALEAARWMQG